MGPGRSWRPRRSSSFSVCPETCVEAGAVAPRCLVRRDGAPHWCSTRSTPNRVGEGAPIEDWLHSVVIAAVYCAGVASTAPARRPLCRHGVHCAGMVADT